LADVPALTTVGSPTVWANADNQDWSLGWEFTVNQAVTVTPLAYNAFGFNNSHDVGIFSSGGTLLTSAIVTGASTLSNGYRYTSVSPTFLAAGTYFISGTTLGLNDGWIYQASTFVTDPSITYDNSFFVAGGGGNLNFPTALAAGRQYLEVNFTVSAAPGPIPGAGMLSYIAIGLLGLGSIGWKRLRAV
jgi:hypothetical protein